MWFPLRIAECYKSENWKTNWKYKRVRKIKNLLRETTKFLRVKNIKIKVWVPYLSNPRRESGVVTAKDVHINLAQGYVLYLHPYIIQLTSLKTSVDSHLRIIIIDVKFTIRAYESRRLTYVIAWVVTGISPRFSISTRNWTEINRDGLEFI